MWIQFHDMHSGGGLKTKWHHVFVEADTREAAIEIFREKTGRDPDHETCDCCGADYSISEEPTLEQATAFERNCLFDSADKVWVEEQDPSKTWASGKYVPLADFEKRDDILILRSSQATGGKP
jgi:hypothetical protein